MSTRILFIGAHNDECDYGCGGITALLTQKGCDVHYLNVACFWHTEAATEGDIARWEGQEQKAAEILGAQKTIIGPRDGYVYENGRGMVLAIEKFVLDYNPDIVFIHWPYDNHVEHRMVAHDSFHALKWAALHGARIKEIYAYEAGINQSVPYFRYDFFVDVTSVMPLVEESLACYDQPTAKGEDLWREKLAGTALRGCSMGRERAEAFKIIKFPNENEDFLLKTILNEHFKWAGGGFGPAYQELYSELKL